MPILPSAKKALRVSQRKRKVNQKVRSLVRSRMRKLEEEPSQKNLDAAYSAIDKAVKKNVFHRNKGDRLKSQAAKIVEEK